MTSACFRPASIQRVFEWRPGDAGVLLADLQKHMGLALADMPDPSRADADEAARRDAGDETSPCRQPPERPIRPDRPSRLPLSTMDRHQPQSAAFPPSVDHTDPNEIESDDPNAPTATDILDEYLDDVVDVPGGARDATQALEMRPYYLGTVILAPHVATGSSKGERVAIYDGLQRFTVLTILAAVLRDTTTSRVRKARLDDLINQHGTHRLEQVGSDAVLTDIIQTPGGTLDARDLRGRGQYSDTSKLLIRVKNKLLGVVETWDEGYRARFTEYLLEHVIIGAIRIEDDALARQMFVATNLYGRRLDPVDVLKGQLADALGASEDAHADAFIAHWTRFRQQFGDGFIEFIRVVDAIERKQRQGPTWATDFGTYVADTYGRKR